MAVLQPTPSYRETKEQNVLQERYITIVLSNEYLKDPMPMKCLGCGYTFFATNNIPQHIYTGKIEASDAKKSSDHRCKHCKITYRIY